MHLRCELRGHTEDIRGICVCPLGIVSASRDKTLKIWKESSEPEYELEKTLVGHEDFVVTVIWIPAGALTSFPHGTLASGSRDKSVTVWDVDNAVPSVQLVGHTEQVTALGVLSDGTIVSSAADGTLRTWRNGTCVAVLEGHEGSVVSLLVLPDDHILSGSIDKSIRLWKDGVCISVFSGHADTVRCLALAPGLGIISASHDKTLRLWSMNGDSLTVYDGHAEIVYSCAFSEERMIVSGSEDGTARLWALDGKCLKSIYHPGCVWAVAFLPNGDLVTACSDGIVRIFSEDENRLVFILPREEILASRKGTLPPGVKVDDPSVLYMPGSKDGETKIVAEGHGACAYSWSAAEQEWKKLGDVLGTQPGELASASKFHNGQEWDFVFDVDFEDGAPLKKICMNKDENPYEVAERFLLAEDLPIAYKDQVVQFLMNNTQMGASMRVNADPLTGGSAYQPAASSAPAAANGMGAFGEASITASLKYNPMKHYVQFTAMKAVEPVKNKLLEFNGLVRQSAEMQEFALTDEEIDGSLEHVLGEVSKIAAGQKASLTQADFDLVSKIARFPSDKIFPVLDLCRLLALDISFQETLISLIGPDLDGVLAASMKALGPHQLSLYLLTNSYWQPRCRTALLGAFAKAIDVFRDAMSSNSKNTRVGLSSLVLNAAVQAFMVGKIGVDSGKTQLLDTAVDIIDNVPQEDSETLFRALVAVGTLLYDDSGLKRYARGTKLLALAVSMKSHSNHPQKLKDALKDLDIILK